MFGFLMLDQNLFVLEYPITVVTPRLLIILENGLLLLLPHCDTT